MNPPPVSVSALAFAWFCSRQLWYLDIFRVVLARYSFAYIRFGSVSLRSVLLGLISFSCFVFSLCSVCFGFICSVLFAVSFGLDSVCFLCFLLSHYGSVSPARFAARSSSLFTRFFPVITPFLLCLTAFSGNKIHSLPSN